MRNLVALLALVCGIAQAADPAVVIAPAAGLPGRYIVAGNRLAEGKSELTGLLGGPTRSEKD